VIARLAGRQHGVVARRQLLAKGVTAREIDRRVESERLHVIHRGVYLVGHRAAPELAYETAALLAVGAKAVLSHESAAYLHTLLPHPARPVHVSVIGRALPKRSDIHIHRTSTLRRADVTRHEGLAVTRPARTILGLSATRTPDELEAVVAEGMRRLRVPERALRDQLNRHPGARGTRSLRAVLDGPAGPQFTRSKAERLLRRLLRDAGLPSPLSNEKAGPYEVDLLWPEHKLVVEFDGFRFHGDRKAFEDDRKRDAHLHSVGYLVLRITWRRLVEEPHAVIALIATMLERLVSAA
jgi:very-short-patch-repair endonuclease